MAETLNLLMGGTVPDLILLDLRLPDGRGETLLREIRVIPGCTNVKIVLLSAERVLSTRAKELGVAGWIRKPAGRADIQTEVLKHLNAAFLSAL